MWSTFLNTMRVNLREKSSVFWLFCFPIILSTMFMGMFGNIGEVYEIHTMRFAVVADANFCRATNARQMLHAMQRNPLRNEGCGNAMEGAAPDTASGQVGFRAQEPVGIAGRVKRQGGQGPHQRRPRGAWLHQRHGRRAAEPDDQSCQRRIRQR